MQGRFNPKNPKKYRGDPTQIFYRSSWEFTLMLRLDSDSNILEWGSEEVIIPYRSPIDGKIHRYFPDFRIKNASGNVILIEIKPDVQTRPPKQPKRKTKRFIQEVMEYGKNKAKWEAATEYAKDQGWTFKVMTEYDLGLVKKHDK